MTVAVRTWRMFRRTEISLPVLMKEMRTRMRGSRSAVLLFSSTGLAILVGLIILATQWGSFSGDAMTVKMQMAVVGRSLFCWLIALQAVFCVLCAPAFTSGAISIEREQQTLELLLLTRLSSNNIVLGKLFSSLSFIVIILLCTLPVTAISFIFGGVDPLLIATALAIILATVTCFGAIGLYCSTRFARTGTAVTVAYAICITWLALVPITVLLLKVYQQHNSSNDILFGFLLVVGLLLLLASIPSLSVAFILGVVLRRRMTRLAHLIIWGICAIGACLLLYLPDALDIFHAEYFLFANPAVALFRTLQGNPEEFSRHYGYSGGSSTFYDLFGYSLSSGFDKFFIPATIGLLLLGAWLAIRLSIREINRLRQ